MTSHNTYHIDHAWAPLPSYIVTADGQVLGPYGPGSVLPPVSRATYHYSRLAAERIAAARRDRMATECTAAQALAAREG